jgi:hypothetical protein
MPSVEAGPESVQPTVEALARYINSVFAFEYPASWRVIAGDMGGVRHYQWIPIVIGTGDWKLNCFAIPPSGDSLGGAGCEPDIFTVDPGEIVVEVFMWQTPVGFETPGPTATTLSSGLVATSTDSATTSLWQVYLEGWPLPLVIDARFAGPDPERFRQEVRSLVESIVVPASEG